MTLTPTHVKVPLPRSITYSGQSPFPPAGDTGWVNQWLVLRAAVLCLERRLTLSPGIKGEGIERLEAA